MSWSDNRESNRLAEQAKIREKKKDAIYSINSVLAMLAADDDLGDDLKLPIVKVAIGHWTGKNRLPPEQAVRLTDNSRVASVFQKIQRLQYVCKCGEIAVPLDHLINRIPALDPSIVDGILGVERKPSVTPATVPAEDSKPLPSTFPPMGESEPSNDRTASALPAVRGVLTKQERNELTPDVVKSSPFTSQTVPVVIKAKTEESTTQSDPPVIGNSKSSACSDGVPSSVDDKPAAPVVKVSAAVRTATATATATASCPATASNMLGGNVVLFGFIPVLIVLVAIFLYFM